MCCVFLEIRWIANVTELTEGLEDNLQISKRDICDSLVQLSSYHLNEGLLLLLLFFFFFFLLCYLDEVESTHHL